MTMTNSELEEVRQKLPSPKGLEELQKATELIHQGTVVDFYHDAVTLPDGREGQRDRLMHPGGVVVCPMLDNGDVVLVQQFRYAPGQAMIEFPAGKLDAGESPLEAAQRELAEETGYACSEMRPLGKIYTSPGFCNECLWLYHSTGLTTADPVHTCDDEENLQLITLPLAELKMLAAAGDIVDAKTLAILALLSL